MLASPLLTDLLINTHFSIVLSLATHNSLSLGLTEGSPAHLSFAGVDKLSWIMKEVTV